MFSFVMNFEPCAAEIQVRHSTAVVVWRRGRMAVDNENKLVAKCCGKRVAGRC